MTNDDLGDLGYAEALGELESILSELENDAVDVDRLADRVRRAAALIELCRGRIEHARLEVTSVVADLTLAADIEPRPE